MRTTAGRFMSGGGIVATELPKIKDPKTYKQQVEIFQSRGLIIPNEDKAINMLKRVNYYRLSAYALTLKKSDKFFDGVTIDNVYALYEFDRRLRALIMGALENIEVAFRTHIAYLLAHKYGPIGYLNADNFNNVRQ
jgi:abortive infection bacteriophage resistance protein